MGRNKRDAAKKSEKSTLREYFESICVAVILALFIRTFVFQAFKIPTGSMEENLLIGDHLIVNKMLYAPTGTPLETAIAPVRDVKRQDVVVFKFPAEPERDFIKRVIALPGERIAIKNKQVFINGVPLDEPYVFFNEPPGNPELGSFVDSRRDSMPEMLVPEGHYFVMGDNRDNSHDSRFWGTLPAELLKGRALMIYWSYDAPDGRDAYFKEGLDRIIEVLSVIPYFVTHTRWDRFFHLVH
ncbi:MAG TPA: signal peptidase I [Vicinamibacteria bacterium]|nr:signal peptidase I [Vicinamibacteria bacterium]